MFGALSFGTFEDRLSPFSYDRGLSVDWPWADGGLTVGCLDRHCFFSRKWQNYQICTNLFYDASVHSISLSQTIFHTIANINSHHVGWSAAAPQARNFAFWNHGTIKTAQLLNAVFHLSIAHFHFSALALAEMGGGGLISIAAPVECGMGGGGVSPCRPLDPPVEVSVRG